MSQGNLEVPPLCWKKILAILTFASWNRYKSMLTLFPTLFYFIAFATVWWYEARYFVQIVDVTLGTTTTTEQAFGPNHLSRLLLDSEPKSALVPGPTTTGAAWEGKGLLSRLEPPIRTKSPLSRLVAPTGIKCHCLYSLFSYPARAIQLSVFAVLGSGGGSSCPFRPRFMWKLFDSLSI